MRIADITLANPWVFAPLAGISDLPMRRLVKEAGCGLVFSEMVSSAGLVYGSEKTRRLMTIHPDERPVGIQLFGADPARMAQAAKTAEEAGADLVDLNFGCSVRKVLKTGSGSALMKSQDTAQEVIRAVCEAVQVPVTLKMRSGWDRSGQQALDLAQLAQDCGVAAVTVHPRTATQGFGGTADWTLIARVKAAVTIPVIGNGDVRSVSDALTMQRETGCDGVMIGRAAIGNPWLFSDLVKVGTGVNTIPPTLDDRRDTMIRFIRHMVAYYGEPVACRMLRSRLSWFVKGLRHSSRFREAVTTLTSESQAIELVLAYWNALATRSSIFP